MATDPRAALDRFVAALEAHHSALSARRGEDDPAVDDAYAGLADAFEAYDVALGTAYGEVTPFYLVDDDDEDDDEPDEYDVDDLPEESEDDGSDDALRG
jgi:hypothetical protein